MKKANVFLQKRRILLFGWLFSITACSHAMQAANDYEVLCKIYQDIMPKSISPEMKGVRISKRIEREIPEIYVHFYHITGEPADKAYGLFKKAAEYETKKEWKCAAIKAFYSGQFGNEGSN